MVVGVVSTQTRWCCAFVSETQRGPKGLGNRLYLDGLTALGSLT